MTNLVYIILACILTLTFREAMPYVIKWWKRVKSRILRKSNVSTRLNDVEEQINNLTARVVNREKNLKQHIREEVKSYLEELAK